MDQYEVYLDNISFSYENNLVIKNLSLSVKSGEHIGIVGDSGCGKSTVLKILAGLYEPDCGKTTIAGEYSPVKIREKVAMVMQQNSLFHCLSERILLAVMRFQKKKYGLPVKMRVSRNGLKAFRTDWTLMWASGGTKCPAGRHSESK